MVSDKMDPETQLAEEILLADNIGDAVVELVNKKGTITLKGTVESEGDKSMIEEMASELDGVEEVVNKLRISDQQD